MALIRVRERSGAERSVDASDGRPLMDTLRDDGFGVLGTCGGACACGTCHVYIAAEWADQLPPKSEDESMMLEAIGELVEVRPTSRLSCQIEMKPELEGLDLTVGPVA